MKPELLLPAGDLEKMKYAFKYGADAVYAGVPVFSLRTLENKFNIESVKEAVDYAKSLGKKIYLTLNIFPRNFKIPALKKALKPLAALKPDAFIVADPGVIMLCKELAPDVPLHLSVQANNVNWASAMFWHKQGIERIILSREITLPEIREIHDHNPGLELEFFVHGSICMAYSGRCLLSSYLSYRDANQGTCAHSCRWEYKVYKAHEKDEKCCKDNGASARDAALSLVDSEKKGLKKLDEDYYLEELTRPGKFMQIDEDEHGTYIMNSKDLCLIEYLRELKEAGVCSFKVEGRNKTLYYAATVARAYRRALDDMEKGKPFNPENLTELAKTSNRGFIPGFLVSNFMAKAQEYEKSLTYQTYEFVGVVRDVRKEKDGFWHKVEVKGRLDAPVKVEFMTPETDYEFEIKSFKKEGGGTTKVVHPGQKEMVWIRLPRNLGKDALMRKKRESMLKNKPAKGAK